MKFCVYTICKNEINNIDKWIDCMCEADYMLLVDTGSTDGTYEKLLQLKSRYTNLIVSKIKVFPWRFDVARNEAMKFIPKDTDACISMDLDELFMEKGWSKVLKKIWKPNYELGDFVYIDNRENDVYNKKTAMPRTKIHTLKAFWKFPLHEIPFADKDKPNQEGTTDNRNHLHLWSAESKSVNGWKKLIVTHYSTSGSRNNYITLANMRGEDYQGPDAEEIRIIELFKNKKYDECLKNIKEVEKKHFDTTLLNRMVWESNLNFYKAYIYENYKRNPLLALKYYEKSLENGIINYKSMYQLCNLYYSTNQKQKIIAMLQDVIEHWRTPLYITYIQEFDELNVFFKEEFTKYYTLCK